MAFSTVAEWWGSAIISNLVDTAYSYLAECMLPADTESELHRVKAVLPKIAAVMGAAESLKLKYPNSGVNAWLEQFKEAFLAAEDVLDELKYRELEDKVKNRDQVSESSSSTVDSLKRKFKFIGSTISEDTFMKRLRGAVEMLDLAAADAGHFYQFAIALDVHGLARPINQPDYPCGRETTSIITGKNVVGREIEKAFIIEWLKKPASHNHISAFCIVGAGGLGKTTLAQLIFEEISRENHFDRTIWVCVSTSFSVEDITRKILEDLGEKTYNGESLNGLQKSLIEKILSKKVFLILDDVWNDEKMCDWEKLIAPLKFVQQGTKILVTTRMKSVADMLAGVLNVEKENLVLEGLKEQELLELLNKYAFSGYNPDNHKDLQKIGNDIVKKLRGSPLATKVIGSLLNSYMDSHYWKRILGYDSLINLEQAKDVADVLKLSYYHLPVHLQECFRFCSIFPQDYEFNKNELIKMWMASGFIRQELHGGVRPEDIGEEYFNHLLRKSFFEKYSTCEYIYVMHDLIHDMAQNVSKGECCRVEENSKYDIIPSTTQHIYVHGSKIERILNLRNLRTLVITLSQDHIHGDRFVLPNGSFMETLRLLIIRGDITCEILEEVGLLIHLRFLDVNTYNVIQPLRFSKSIYKFYHLQVLDMSNSHGDSDCEGVETTGITNLISLRYMYLPNKVMQNIHEIHKLTSLQVLRFLVGRESGHHIDELEMLNNLRELSIEKIENVRDSVEAMNANLSKKESLTSLYLSWTKGSNSDDPEHVIDNLQPNPNLKELTIWYYTGHRSPIWMRGLSHLYLSSLTLEECPLWETLPFLGQMPYLKRLFLQGMDEVKEVDYSCDCTSNCAFPSLEWLSCRNMPKWESWAGPHICNGFPNLKILTIEDCPNLTKCPSIPFSLSEFEVENVGFNSLPDMHHGSSITALAPSCMKSLLRVVKIIHCSKLLSLNGFLQQENLDLQAIEKLTIEDCKNLLQFPIEGFGKLTSLKSLTIKNCPNLAPVDVWSNLIPVKLQKLTMGNCGELEVPLFKASLGLTNLTKLKMSGISNITPITSPENAFTSLQYLSAYDCPILTKLPNLPLSLNRFIIHNVAVSDLPEYFQSSHSSDPTSSTPKASPRYVLIVMCSNLTSLNGFLQQENIDLRGLVTLYIQMCENLVQLPPHAFGNFVSLKELAITDCPKLVVVDNRSIILPVKLQYLHMGNCGELDVPLLESASKLSTLDRLSIENSASTTCIPSSENAFPSLKQLRISRCGNLIELSSMQQADTGNPGINLVSLNISHLDIDHFGLLLIEPLRCLRSVSHLIVRKCSVIGAMPEQWLLENSSTLKQLFIDDASSLRSLPGTMVKLTALEELRIYNATSLKEIPELPTSLISKSISQGISIPLRLSVLRWDHHN